MGEVRAVRGLGPASVPPAGAHIGFFGKRDIYPRWCRECVVKEGDEALLAAWDEAVNAEAARRAAYSARQATAMTKQHRDSRARASPRGAPFAGATGSAGRSGCCTATPYRLGRRL